MTVIDRFLKLVSYPTTSDERSQTCPSTPQQRVLAEELVRQMQELGIQDARVDAYGYVYGTIPANCEKDIPVYGLIAHMDTAPDAPGENIRARVTEAYDGGDVVLNEEKHIVLSPKEYPQMKHAIGKRLIVTDGTTLLGADDKAGVAEILSAAELLLTSDRKHGTVKLAFTLAEELDDSTGELIRNVNVCDFDRLQFTSTLVCVIENLRFADCKLVSLTAHVLNKN